MKLFEKLAFWKRWDDQKKASARMISCLVLLALTAFSFIATVSYLFTWKQDMSASGISNAAGELGHRFGHLLVCECFGLGSLAFSIILGCITVRLFTGKFRFSLLKTVIVCLTGAFFSSVLLSFVGNMLGQRYAFGGGLGGQCGSYLSDLMIKAMGVIPTGLVILVAVACWAIMSISGVAAAVCEKFVPKPKKRKVEMPEMEEIVFEDPEPAGEPAASAEPEDVPSGIPAGIPAVEIPEADVTGTTPEPGFEIVQGEGVDVNAKKDLPRIDNRLDPPDGLPHYKFYPMSLLDGYEDGRKEVTPEELTKNKNKICSTLNNYKIQIAEVKAIVGPTVTLYKVFPAPGVKISSIKTLQEDIAMSLNAKGVRIITLSDSVGIEVANDHPSIVPLKGLLNDSSFRDSSAELPVALGYTITQKVKIFDLADAPHLLIAGATKQGKSVCLNVIISSLLYAKHPSELKFVFIDPKMVEFTSYSSLLKHYLAVLPDAADEEEESSKSIVKNAKDAEKVLRSLCQEMDDRYNLLSRAGVNKLSLYNDKYKDHKLNPEHGHRFLPYIVVVVDEYADLTMSIGAGAESKAASRSITTSIIRLAQKGRAAGMHVILATQRPSVDVISGLIKSNFPMRIAFRTASRTDSQTIIDAPGAEKLIGRGDMLFSAGIDNERIQCGYISGEEIDRITEFIGEQKGYGKCYNTPYYLPVPADNGGSDVAGGIDMSNLDDKFEEAARMVVTTQRGSTSDLQRRLGMGYAKAGRVMDQLQAAGIVGPQEGSKPRQVLVPDLESLEEILKQ